MHHGHGVGADDVGVTPEDAEHFVVFGVPAQILDADVPVADGDVYFVVPAADLDSRGVTPRMSSSSICSK